MHRARALAPGEGMSLRFCVKCLLVGERACSLGPSKCSDVRAAAQCSLARLTCCFRYIALVILYLDTDTDTEAMPKL